MFCIQCCFANPNRSGPKGLFCQFSGKQAQLLQARSPFSVLMSVFAEVCSNQTTRPNHPPTTYQTRSRSWFKRRAAMCRMKLFPEQSLGLGVKARRRAYFKQEGAISRAQHRHETLGTARGSYKEKKATERDKSRLRSSLNIYRRKTLTFYGLKVNPSSLAKCSWVLLGEGSDS